jgi:hypothetical protein
MIKETWIRKFIAVWVAITILVVYSTIAAGTPGAPWGEMSVSGDVTVDGQKAISGGTFFSGSTIVTAANSSATLSLGTLGRIELLPNSSLSVSLARNGIAGLFCAGRGRFSTPEGVQVNLSTEDASVIVNGSEATSFTVNTEKGSTIVATETGLAELRSGAGVEEVAAGESAVAGAEPQAIVARLATRANRPILVNGAGAASGAIILTGATLETPDQVGATIDLGSLGILDVAPNTKLMLDFDQNGNVKVTLAVGCVIMRHKKGMGEAEIDTPAGPAAKTEKRKRGLLDVCFPPGATQPIVNQGAASSAGAGAQAAATAAGHGLSTLTWVLIAVGVAIGVVVVVVTTKNNNANNVVSPTQ